MVRIVVMTVWLDEIGGRAEKGKWEKEWDAKKRYGILKKSAIPTILL